MIIAVILPRGTGRAAAGAPPPGTAEPGYWQRFGEGLAFLRREPLLLTVVVTVGITNLLDAAFATVLLPVWAKSSGNGPAALGLLGSAMGAAAVGGSLIAAMAAHRLRRRMVFFTGFLLGGVPRFLVLACDVPLGVAVAVFAVGGFGMGFVNPVLGAVLFERVPRHLLGRVRALGDSLAWAGIPLGGLLAGAAVAAAGLVPVLLVSGTVYLLTTGLAGLRPEWREMDRPGGEAAVSSSGGLSAAVSVPDRPGRATPG